MTDFVNRQLSPLSLFLGPPMTWSFKNLRATGELVLNIEQAVDPEPPAPFEEPELPIQLSDNSDVDGHVQLLPAN
jgi:hypothetical protein